MTTSSVFAATTLGASDLRRTSRTAVSRKSDTHFAGLMEEEQAARQTALPLQGQEVRGRMQVLATPGATPPETAPAAAAPKNGIPLNVAERRARAQQLAQTVRAAQGSPDGAKAASPRLPANSPQPHADPGMLASLMGDTNPRNLGHMLGRSSQAVRAVLTGEAPRGIALPTQGRGIALDAATRQQLARAHAVNHTQPTPRAPRAASSSPKPKDLGKLAAQFESGSDGIAAIGYDRNGGTSYGKYQIASRPGTMTQFIEFLQDEAPDMAKRLAAAGPANTGSRTGTMPEAWRELASQQPERFEKLQEKFIHESHYLPARSTLAQYGYQTEKLSPAMQEVLFSTAVQHGPAGASRIFARAAERIGLSADTQQRQEQQLIQEIYTLRADQFGSSTPQVQMAVRRRMAQEQQLAMTMSHQKPAAA